MKSQIVLIVHNVRSTHNVGSMLRTADGLGVNKVIFSGYTPYPLMLNDSRMPHLANKLHKQIHKTALGAEESIEWQYHPDITAVIEELKDANFEIVALEQSEDSEKLTSYERPPKVALIVGREVEGIEPEVLAMADTIVEIPMVGKKESFNVSVATGMALYHLRYM